SRNLASPHQTYKRECPLFLHSAISRRAEQMATSPRTATTVYPPARALQIDQVQDLLKLEKAAKKITSILDLDQLIDQIVNDVASSFGCLEANIFLHDEDRAELVVAGVHGCTMYGKGHRLKVGKEGMVGYVAATGQMRYAPDVRVDPYYIGCEESTLSEVAIPLQVGQQLVGVFTASHPELDAFPQEQLRILQALCSHMAAALLMSATRGMLRSLAEACCTPGEVLTRLNRLLVDDFPSGRFVTMVYAVLDPANRMLTFANAGHLRPLLVTVSEARFLETE